jgi:hypothetical protein
VVVNTTTGQLGINTSSRRFKRSIHAIGARRLRGVMALRPVSFLYRHGAVNGPNRRQFGLIAEDVAKVYPNLVAYGRDGRPLTVLYQELPALLLAKVQSQQHHIDRLEAQVRKLARRR